MVFISQKKAKKVEKLLQREVVVIVGPREPYKIQLDSSLVIGFCLFSDLTCSSLTDRLTLVL